MDEQQRQDWIKEKTRHIDEINDLLERLNGIIDAADPEGNDEQLDDDCCLIEAALEHYRGYWQNQVNEIREM